MRPTLGSLRPSRNHVLEYLPKPFYHRLPFVSAQSILLVIALCSLSSFFPPTIHGSSPICSLSSSLFRAFPKAFFAFASEEDAIMVDDVVEDESDLDSMAPAAKSRGLSSSLPSMSQPSPDSPARPSPAEIAAAAAKNVNAPNYRTPDFSSKGIHFVELFESDANWKKSAHTKFTGPWELSLRTTEGIRGDYGLKVGASAQFHGIAGRMERLETMEGKHFILQYEAKFENDLHCGGAYMKVFDLGGEPLEKFDADTDYVIMFGPDRCGETDKVHCIVKMKNPKNNKTTEHHLNAPPSIPSGSQTHLYTLWIKPDNTLEIWIDNKLAKSADMAQDMSPPMLPPKEIDDDTDTKPAEWEDNETVADPAATKPEDWDEEAPAMVVDPSAAMPEGWLEKELSTIADPSASKPEDWDVEEDGEWEAPRIANPLCAEAPGCGEWKAPMIANPNYKGMWEAPTIPNPVFKGPWVARKMLNPDYFERPLHALSPMDSLGFELWTMQSGLLFDNILVGTDIEAVKRFTEQTWKIRKDTEDEIIHLMKKMAAEQTGNAEQPLPDSMPMSIKALVWLKRCALDYPFAIIGTAFSIVFGMIFLTLRRSSAKKTSPPAEKEDVSPMAEGEAETEGSEGQAESTVTTRSQRRKLEEKEEDNKNEEEEEEKEEEAEEAEDEKEEKPQARRRRAQES